MEERLNAFKRLDHIPHCDVLILHIVTQRIDAEGNRINLLDRDHEFSGRDGDGDGDGRGRRGEIAHAFILASSLLKSIPLDDSVQIYFLQIVEQRVLT